MGVNLPRELPGKRQADFSPTRSDGWRDDDVRAAAAAINGPVPANQRVDPGTSNSTQSRIERTDHGIATCVEFEAIGPRKRCVDGEENGTDGQADKCPVLQVIDFLDPDDPWKRNLSAGRVISDGDSVGRQPVTRPVILAPCSSVIATLRPTCSRPPARSGGTCATAVPAIDNEAVNTTLATCLLIGCRLSS